MHDTHESRELREEGMLDFSSGDSNQEQGPGLRTEVALQQADPSSLSDEQTKAEGPSVPRQSPWLLLLFVLLTGGIYEAFWYRKVARFLNGLEGRKKFGSLSFVFLLVGYSCYFLLSMVKGSNESLGIQSEGIQMLSGTLWMTMTGFVILVSLRMAESLRNWHERENRPFRCNHLLTVFLNIFYLQHKLNRLP